VIDLSGDIEKAINSSFADQLVVMVASASAAGMPDIAFKGSTMVFDDEHMAFWERSHGQTLRNLAENPQVCLLYRNPQARVAWKFFGVAELHREGDLRQQIMDRTVEFELGRDPERKGVAVYIRVDKVISAGQVLMEREASGAGA
jgi:hypothetical protein